MFSQLKLQARQALLPAAKRMKEMLLPVVFVLLPIYFLLLALTLYYPQFYLLRFGYAVLLTSVALPVIELAFQVKLILSAKGKNTNVRISFKYALKSCAVKLLVRVLKLRNFFLYEILPVLLIVLFFGYVSLKPLSFKAAAVCLAGTTFLFLTGIVFYFISVQKYSRAVFCLAAYENISPLEAVRLSKKMAQSGGGKLFALRLSFIPWFVLCVAVLPALFVIPYYKQSITCYFLNNG